MAKYLVVEDLAKLLQERLHDPDLEAEYRRGFADCAGAFFQAIDFMPPEITRANLGKLVFAWWKKLMAWQQGEPDEAQQPPEFQWKEQDSGVVDSGPGAL